MNNQKIIKRYLNQVCVGYYKLNAMVTLSWFRNKVEFIDGTIEIIYQYTTDKNSPTFYQNNPPLHLKNKTEWAYRNDYPMTDEQFSHSN